MILWGHEGSSIASAHETTLPACHCLIEHTPLRAIHPDTNERGKRWGKIGRCGRSSVRAPVNARAHQDDWHTLVVWVGSAMVRRRSSNSRVEHPSWLSDHNDVPTAAGEVTALDCLPQLVLPWL
jgi:hypothetical protein